MVKTITGYKQWGRMPLDPRSAYSVMPAHKSSILAGFRPPLGGCIGNREQVTGVNQSNSRTAGRATVRKWGEIPCFRAWCWNDSRSLFRKLFRIVFLFRIVSVLSLLCAYYAPRRSQTLASFSRRSPLSPPHHAQNKKRARWGPRPGPRILADPLEADTPPRPRCGLDGAHCCG